MSDSTDDLDRLLPQHGGYRQLRSFQAALVIYDATVVFCDRFIDKRSRTHDQMVQAARSGVQNIAEGSVDSGTSKKTELKLTNVARGSLEELLRDYTDYLRQRGLPIWDKNSPQALKVRRRYQSARSDRSDRSDKSDLSDESDKSDRSDRSDQSDPTLLAHLRTACAEVAANTLLCLINQATYLLRRQISRLEQDFLKHGGITERLYAVRTKTREKVPSEPSPACPACGKPMRLRTARHRAHAGQQFWGCSAYPDCKGIRPK